MEVLVLLFNSAILSLLYQKQLEQSEDLGSLKARLSSLEALAVERRRRGKEGLTTLLRDDTM